MKTIKVLSVLVASQLAACSWLFDDRTEDYRKAEEAEPLKLPKRVDPEDFKEALVIPEGSNSQKLSTKAEEYVAPRPDPLIVEEDDSGPSLKDFKDNELQVNLVVDGSGTPTLRLNVDFARAWTEVGQALQKAEYKVDDFNRSIGTYYLEIPLTQEGETKEEESCWFGCDDEEFDPTAFELKLNRARTGVFVALHKDADTLAEPDLAKKVLSDVEKRLK